MNTTSELASNLVSEIEQEKDLIFQQLKELTAFHSVHSVPELIDDHRNACEWVCHALQDLDFPVQRFTAESGIDTIVAHRPARENAPTVLLYSHYDVVFAGDPQAWETPATELSERNGRWYARGAADCKGNFIMHLAALRALQRHDPDSPLGIKVVVEGSEEQGGAEMHALLQEQPELFAADAILIADTGNEAVGVPTLTTALRGGADITVRVDTLENAVHSGSFGGAAPDAVAALVRILDSFRDAEGRTIIDGINTNAHWEGSQYSKEQFRSDAGVLAGVDVLGGEDAPSNLVWARPAITTIGFESTPLAQAVNAVPATAAARLNLRVPPGLEATEVAQAVEQHIRNHAPWNVQLSIETTNINEAFTTDTSGVAMQQLAACLAAAYGKEQVTTVGAGGSIPLCTDLIAAHPQAELALFGVEEPQCAIHSPNESVDPNEIIKVAAAEAAFLLSYHVSSPSA